MLIIFCAERPSEEGAVMGLPVSLVIVNIYMEYFESLAIPTSPTLIK